VRGEFMPTPTIRVLRLADAADGGIDLALQMLQRRIGAHRRPQAVRLAVPELTHAMQLQIEGGSIDRGQRIAECRRVTAVHLADKAQGQVQLLAGLPARARHPALNQQQRLGDGIGDR